MPYTRTPPGVCRASKIVTWWPLPARNAAHVKPAGPDPTTATLLPVGFTSGICLFPRARSQSATNRSRQPIATDDPSFFFSRIQPLWHWTSLGHTRPVTPGSLFSVLRIFTALGKSPSSIAAMNPGISTEIGHSETHPGSLHLRHLLASSRASSSV